MEPKYKLIGIDIDGTLTNSRGEISARTKTAIHRVAEIGAQVVVATGRRFFTARPKVLPLDFPDLLLAVHNGAILKRLNGEVIYHDLLPREIAQQTVALAKTLGLCPIIFEGTQHAANILVEDYGDRIDAWQRGYLEENREHLRWVRDLATDVPGDVIEVICVVPAAQVHEIVRAFQEQLDGQVKPILVIVNNGQQAFVGLSNAVVGKHRPLEYLAAQMGLERAEILAIGDNYNDLDMLQYAGTGVIMANADVSLKIMGFHETETNDADGVAVALENLVLGGTYVA